MTSEVPRLVQHDTEYIEAVATALEAQAVQWWDGHGGVDVVLVLPHVIEYFRPRRVVLAWNRHFGWSMGVESLTSDAIDIITSLAAGPHPASGVCVDRAIETFADLRDWTPPPDTSSLPFCPEITREMPRTVRGRFTLHPI